MMTDSISPRELVAAALQGHTSPRLLRGELFVDPDLIRSAFGLAEGAALPLAAEAAVQRRWGHDLAVVSFSHGWGAPQQPDEEDAFFRLSWWHENTDLFVFALIDGPFSILAKTWGWEQTLMRMGRSDPEIEIAMADAVLELSMMAERIASSGGDGIILGDDIAYRRGPYARPEVLRRVYFPYLTLITLAIQDLGLPVVFHSDGNLWPIWTDLLAVPINGIQGLEAQAAMSLLLARQRSRSPRGERLCLWGNLDLGWLAQAPPPTAIAAHLAEILAPVRGPIILGASGGLTAGLPLPTLDALAQVVTQQSYIA